MTGPVVDPEVRCDWCGKGPQPWLTVVTGAGMAICEDCVELVVVVIEEAKKKLASGG